MSDEFNPVAGYNDLACRADSIYNAAIEQAGAAENDSGWKGAMDIALKAVALQAKLREMHRRPAELETLRKDIERVEKTVKAHYAGIDDRAGEKAPRTGEAPPWRQ